MLHIERRTTIGCADPGALVEGRAHFERHHWVRLPGFLEGALLGRVRRGIATATFVEVRHDGVTPPSVDVSMEPNPTAAMLELFCNDATVLRTVEALTGAVPLVRFAGFVYRLTPGSGHHHNWHNDLVHERRVAMSVNLEDVPYEGGILQIRERDSGRVLEQVANTGAGDALLFRLDAALQHRATAVTRGVKTAFAGWFRSAEPLGDELRRSRHSLGEGGRP